MRKSAKLAIELSEIREKLNGPDLSAPDLTDEKKAERARLEERSLAAEGEFRAAVKAEAEEDASRELRAVTRQIEARSYVRAVLNEGKLEGAEAEFNKELGLRDHEMPWEALLPLPHEDRAAVEDRVDAATTVNANAIGEPQQAAIARVFAPTDAAFFGVRFPSVASGTPNYPIMSAGASGDMANPGVAVDSEAATITGSTIAPSRGSAAYLIRVEDIAQFAGYEALLRSDLRTVMGRLMDKVVINGNAADPAIVGLVGHAAAAGADPSATLKIGDLDATIAGGIDGTHVRDASGVRLFVGTATGKYLRQTRQTGTNQNPADTLETMVRASGVGAIRASGLVGAPASNIQTNYRFSTAATIAVAPVWAGVSLIRDPYSNAASGQVRITATMLFGFDALRDDIQGWKAKLA